MRIQHVLVFAGIDRFDCCAVTEVVVVDVFALDLLLRMGIDERTADGADSLADLQKFCKINALVDKVTFHAALVVENLGEFLQDDLQITEVLEDHQVVACVIRVIPQHGRLGTVQKMLRREFIEVHVAHLSVVHETDEVHVQLLHRRKPFCGCGLAVARTARCGMGMEVAIADDLVRIMRFECGEICVFGDLMGVSREGIIGDDVFHCGKSVLSVIV